MNIVDQTFVLAYVIAPIVLMALGYIAVRLNERQIRKHHTHPAE